MTTQRQSFSRITFETPRVSEYFNARELTTLTGQPASNFAAVVQKEISDNALDGAESVNVAPELAFEIQTSGELLTVSVTDNGPGIPPELIQKVLDFSIRASDKAAYRSPTRGAQGNALKTVVGMPVFQAAEIGQRFDMAIIAGEGYATEAVRMLFTRAREGRYRLFVLHDADPHGYNIARTLAEETRRMPGYSVEVTDLGLNLEEALDMGLQTEKFIRRKALPTGLNLNETERRYFEGESRGRNQWECTRVELNAFTAPGLIEFLERKLNEVGATTKVVPPREFLEARSKTVYTGAVQSWVNENGAKLLGFDHIASSISKRFESEIRRVSPDRLGTAFAEDPTKSWRAVVDDDIARGIDAHQASVMEALKQEIEKRVERFSKHRKRN
jgi:hypothetical protein